MDTLIPKEGGCLTGFLMLLLSPVFIVLLPLTMIPTMIIEARDKARFAAHPKRNNYFSYLQALSDSKRARRDFWLNLSGHAFEYELAELYRRLGYSAFVTPGSGDKGIDIELTKDAERTIVQCKNHSRPAGPAIIRELYGCLIASGADAAILACTSGFTKGVYEFAEDKPITLVDLESILKMHESLIASQPRFNAVHTI